MLQEEELRGVPICIMANKQDAPGTCCRCTHAHASVRASCVAGALPPEAVAEGLGMTGIKDRPWAIFKCSATKNEGIAESLDWIGTSILGK